MNDFFEIVLAGISQMYSMLDSIPVISGVSVLDFLIACVVVSVIFPILLTIIKSSKKGEVK